MVGAEVREVHIVGGHHPDWPFEYYERVIAALHAARPEVQIKAFTAAEIDYFWRRSRIEPKDALTRLKAAGDRKSTRLNSSHGYISYAVFCLKKKNRTPSATSGRTSRTSARNSSSRPVSTSAPQACH